MPQCIFCQIIEGSLPCEKVFENDHIFAFKDISPQAPVHILIVPKKHIRDVLEVTHDDLDIFKYLFQAAQHIASQQGLGKNGFRTVFNTGKHACQTVFHLHLHLLGGVQMGGNMVG